MEKNFLLGVGITNATEQGVLKYIITGLEKREDPYYVVTPNPEILVYANKHSSFKAILNSARLACPDGIGVIWGGRVVGQNFKERVTGTDLVKNLCKWSAKKPITMGFLGGRSKIAERTSLCLLKKFPTLKIVFVAPEWGDSGFKTAAELDLRFKNEDLRINPKDKIINHKSYFLNRPQIDILFVALGFPKQEEWMASHVDRIPVKVMIGVGGAFDYISGSVPYAPKFVRSLGFEWLFRLIRQPWRLKRQLKLLEFAMLVLKVKVGIIKK